jgi:hypothetical protein
MNHTAQHNTHEHKSFQTHGEACWLSSVLVLLKHNEKKNIRLKHMKAAESLKLEIISCKLAATERCEVATDQREVTLLACLQLPACSQIKQTHYMKLGRTTTKNKNHSTKKLITKANLKPGQQHKTNEILNSSEFSISTRSLPQQGSAYQASRSSTLISVGETARSSHNASIPSGLSCPKTSGTHLILSLAQWICRINEHK